MRKENSKELWHRHPTDKMIKVVAEVHVKLWNFSHSEHSFHTEYLNKLYEKLKCNVACSRRNTIMNFYCIIFCELPSSMEQTEPAQCELHCPCPFYYCVSANRDKKMHVEYYSQLEPLLHSSVSDERNPLQFFCKSYRRAKDSTELQNAGYATEIHSHSNIFRTCSKTVWV